MQMKSMKSIYALVLCQLMVGLPLLSLMDVSGIAFDPDESGYAPTTMDCDTSNEDSFCIDQYDDFCRKKIWVNSDEIADSDGVHVMVYGKAAGSEGNTYGASIIINDNTAYEDSEDFFPTDYFSPYRFGWHLFWFPTSDFIGDSWNTIDIVGYDSDYTKENLWVGIDQSFPSSDTYPVYDFQRSAWDNSNNQNPDPDFDTGELMIRIYFYSEDTGFYDYDYERDSVIPIDDTYDKCEKQFLINSGELSDCTMAQIAIWGYAWGTANPNSNSCYVKINGDKIYFNVYDVFMDNIYGFGIINFPADEYLIENSENSFYFGDDSDYQSENFAIGLDTDTVHHDSKWFYSDGTTHGYWSWGPNHPHDEGELMISFCLFERRETSDYRKEYSITYIENYEYSETLDIDCAPYLQDYLADRSWNEVQYAHDTPYVDEGDFYEEFTDDAGEGDCADSADFLYHAGHGYREMVTLYHDQGTNLHGCDDTVRFTFDPNAPTYQMILECDISGDGLDCDAEWIWLQVCRLLEGRTNDNDNIFKTILYHGAHILFSNDASNDITDAAMESIMISFCSYAFDGEHTIIEAFDAAYYDAGKTMGKYFYHSCNEDDYLWGVSTGPTYDCYSHSDVVHGHVPNGG
jgi:hypothetical protein